MKVVTDHYFCDYCSKELTEIKHISVTVSMYAGWVSPPNWKHKKDLGMKPYQWCDEKCMNSFLKTNAKKRGRPKKK